MCVCVVLFFLQAEDGIRDLVRSRGLGDVYKRQGFSGMIIDFSITWILKEKIRINKYIANSTGFILAATSNYFINHFWTFESNNNRIFAEYITFITVSYTHLTLPTSDLV